MRRLAGPLLVVWGVARAGGAQEQLPPAEGYKVLVEYRSWRPGLTADLQKGADGQEGTDLNVKDDLGIADQRTSEYLGAFQFTPGVKIRGSYTKLDYSGDVTASRTFRYGATTYAASGRVTTSLTGGYYTGALEWDFFKSSSGYLGGLVGVKFLNLDGTLVAPDQGLREERTLKAPIPVLGVAGATYIGRVSLYGEFSGLTIGKRGNLYEAEALAYLHVSDRLAVGGGYRIFHVKGETTLEHLQVRMRGWQFGAQLGL